MDSRGFLNEKKTRVLYKEIIFLGIHDINLKSDKLLGITKSSLFIKDEIKYRDISM